MSYRITEAERKHVAVIEDLKLNLSVTAEEGTTPAVNLEITDSDKLNLSASFPQYAIDVDKTDDEHSRFRLVDAKTRETVLTCEGLRSLNGNPLGLGWRYGLEFILDDDGYVKGISLINKNNGNKADKIITKLADMEIKSIVVPESDQTGLTVNAKALFTKAVTINTDSTDNALSVRNAKGKHATIGDVQFTDDTAIKTEGKTRLAEISTDDIELVNDESEVSITAQKTTFKDTEIELDRTVINGKGDSRINELKSLSSQNIIGNNVTTESLNATSISATSENVNSLEAGNANIDTAQIGVENVTSSNIETATVGNETAENLTVHQKAHFEGDTYTRALDVDGKLIAGEIKSLSSLDAVDTNTKNLKVTDSAIVGKIEAGTAEIISEKVSSLEAKNIKATRLIDTLKLVSQTDIDAARNVIAGKGVVTDLVKDKNNETLLEKIGDAIAVGNVNSPLILKTKSDESKTSLDKEYKHFKVYIDGVETYLANLDDIGLTVDGYVNRSTNQDISGVKTFNDVIVAPAGIGIKDEEGHLRGIISHVDDYTDIAFRQNPDYIAAKREAEEYDSLLAEYSHLKVDHRALQTITEEISELESHISEANTQYNDSVSTLNNLNTSKAELESQLREANASLISANANIESLNTTVNSLQNDVDAAQQQLNVAQSNIDNEIADASILQTALDETLYFNDDFNDSFLKNNEDYFFLKNMSCENVSYENAIAAFDKMINVLNILSESTQENVVAYCNLTKEHILNELKPVIVGNHQTLVNTKNDKLATLNEANEALTSFQNTTLADALNNKTEIEGQIASLESQIGLVADEIQSCEDDIDDINDDIQSMTEDKLNKESDLSRNKPIYKENYITYANKINFEYTDETIENCTIDEPVMNETVASFKNNEIPQTVYGKSETIHLGNSKDTLKVMSKGLHSGENIDEHIQATIDGHDHILANTDDIVAKNVMSAFDVRHIDERTGEEMIDPGKIVGDVSTREDAEGATIIIGKAPVISGYDGQVIPEDQDSPSRVDDIIKLKSDDGSVIITSNDEGEINFSIGNIDAIDDRVKDTIKNVSVNDSSFIFTKDDGSSDEVLLVSTNDDLSIEALGDKILDINMNNFYNNELVEKDDILRLYDQVQPRDLRKVANAFDVKVLTDAVSARVDILARNLEERLPVAPQENGRYYLVANVRRNMAGETTSTYTWDGNGALPEIHVVTDINQVMSEADFDADGNFYVPYEAPEYAEYCLRMRILKSYDENGKVKYSPVTAWVRMDKDSADYNIYSVLRHHPAVVNAVAEGMSEQDAIALLVSKIDTNSDFSARYLIYNFNNKDWTENGDLLSSCFRNEGRGKIGATLADVINLKDYDVMILLDNSNPHAKYAVRVSNPSPEKKLNDILTNELLYKVTTEEEAAEILITDNAMIGLISKRSEIPFIGD